MSDWYYVQNGEQKGPITEEALQELINLHTIPRDSLVWTEGLNDWTSADQACKFLKKTSLRPGAARPWVRFFARMVDYSIVNVFVMIILHRLSPMFAALISTFINPLVLCAYAFVETGMLNTFQTTPGKSLLKVTLKSSDGNPLTPSQCLNRSFRVWAFGEGLGLPLISLIANLMAYLRLTDKGITSWDEATGVEVSHEEIGVPRIAATVVILLVLNFSFR